MAQSNPFLDPTRDIMQGKTEEEILADWQTRQHAAAGAAAEANPGYEPLEGYVPPERPPVKGTSIIDNMDSKVREHLRECGVPEKKLKRMGLDDMAQYIFDDFEEFSKRYR